MIPIKGKIVLITGASSGIGRALAEQLAAEGALLALAARRVAKLEELARELSDKHKNTPLVLPTDVSRAEDVRSMVKKTHDHYGRIDVLVNNAGVLRMAPLLAMPEEEMRMVFETNFWSVVRVVKEAALLMGRQGDGHILNVGSGVSRRGLPFMAAYSASKWALAGLTESLRVELSNYKLAWTNVYPGGVETEMPTKVDRSRLPANYPDHTRRRISAERCARAIVKAIRCRPLEVYVPWYIRQAAWLSVFAPSVADFIIGKGQRLR
jgi:short-subunit dehydrogenase